MMLKSCIRTVVDMIYCANFIRLAENSMRQLRFLKNTIVSTSRILILQWQNISRALVKLMMQSDTTSKVRHIEPKSPECSAPSVFTIDCNLSSKLKKNQNFTDGGPNTSRPRVLSRKPLAFTDSPMTTAQ
jgi:hypothetical protein